MAQTFTDDCFAGTHVGQTDLQNMEDNFQALKSSFSGTSAPANQTPGQKWFDTANNVLKIRNAADTAWYGIMQGDASQKAWIYRNDAGPGWVVDTTPSDTVLAVKGGSTYTTGGAGAGTWTISGFPSHSHDAGSYAMPDHSHTLVGATIFDPGFTSYQSAQVNLQTYTGGPSAWLITGTSGTSTPVHDGTWRPAASVGTIQYLDLT